MKKVLFVVHNLKIGGVQKISVELARHHVLAGNEVHILCLEKGRLIDVDFDCHVHTLDTAKFLFKHPFLGIYYLAYKLLFRRLFPNAEFYFSTPVFKAQVSKLLRELETSKKFDAIFIRGPRAIKGTWWLKRKEIIRSHHLPSFPFGKQTKGIIGKYNHFLASCLFKDNAFFAVSDYIASSLKSSLRLHSVPVKTFDVINNPCNIERIKLLSEQKVEKVLEIEGKYILGVGRLCKQKRFDLLIKAYHAANLKDYKLVILGEGNLRSKLEKLIDSLDLNDHIIMPGSVKNPYPYYKNATLFVLSSDNEGFVNVITEALACGTPVVSTDCGPVGEILKGRLAQGIAPKGEYLPLAEKINEYLIEPVMPRKEDVAWLSFDNIISQQMAMVDAQSKQWHR